MHALPSTTTSNLSWRSLLLSSSIHLFASLVSFSAVPRPLPHSCGWAAQAPPSAAAAAVGRGKWQCQWQHRCLKADNSGGWCSHGSGAPSGKFVSSKVKFTLGGTFYNVLQVTVVVEGFLGTHSSSVLQEGSDRAAAPGVMLSPGHPVIRIRFCVFAAVRYRFSTIRKLQMVKTENWKSSGNYPVATRSKYELQISSAVCAEKCAFAVHFTLRVICGTLL